MGDWTPDDERRARELLAAATPRPWEAHDYQVWMIGAVFAPCPNKETAAFIAAAPDLLERALGEIERLEAQANAEESLMNILTGQDDLTEALNRADTAESECERLRGNHAAYQTAALENERLRAKVATLEQALRRAREAHRLMLDFAQTVAPDSSWWEDSYVDPCPTITAALGDKGGVE